MAHPPHRGFTMILTKEPFLLGVGVVFNLLTLSPLLLSWVPKSEPTENRHLQSSFTPWDHTRTRARPLPEWGPPATYHHHHHRGLLIKWPCDRINTMRAGINTFRIPSDSLTYMYSYSIRIRQPRKFFTYVHCISKTRISAKRASYVYLIQIRWCSEFSTYVYVY